jgi:hypothetical protein
MSDSKYFYRGREARGLGLPRILNNGRVSPKTRQEFYDGWDHEDRMRAPKASPEQIAEVNAGLAAIRAQINAMP